MILAFVFAMCKLNSSIDSPLIIVAVDSHFNLIIGDFFCP